MSNPTPEHWSLAEDERHFVTVRLEDARRAMDRALAYDSEGRLLMATEALGLALRDITRAHSAADAALKRRLSAAVSALTATETA